MANAGHAPNLADNAPIVPAPVDPVGPVAIANPARDLVADRNQEAQRDRQIADQRRNRFMVRRTPNVVPRGPHDPALECAIFTTAVGFPLTPARYPRFSTFIPNFQSVLYYLNFMDNQMCSTKRWTDNCLGWAPPYSQIYISILLYIQTIRAMDAAGYLLPGSDFALLLRNFETQFSLDALWIPGPLVSAFKHLASFRPSATDLFGNCTPILPSYPGWSIENMFSLPEPICSFLPNISVFMSRLHSTCAAANRVNTTQSLFINDVSGPRNISHLFNVALDDNVNNRLLVRSPGASLTYSGSLQLWLNASDNLEINGVPPNLDAAVDEVENDWNSFLWFDTNANWFGRLVAMMARYGQFWKGSVPLSECAPNCSAAGAVRLTATRGTDIFDRPEWSAPNGNHSHTQRGNANQIGHYRARQALNLTMRAATNIEDIPDAQIYAALTYHFNLVRNNDQAPQIRQGPLWDATPDTHNRSGIQVYQGVFSSIVRDYHNDVRLDSSRQ